MNNLELTILSNCSGKNYKSLIEAYGKNNIDSLVNKGYIAILQNGSVTRTELGMSLSKPMTSVTNEKLGKDGYQLIVDADAYSGEGQMLHS
jgi:hypothetical protein